MDDKQIDCDEWLIDDLDLDAALEEALADQAENSRNSRPWTIEEVAQLKEMLGWKSYEEIGAELDRSLNAVILKLQRKVRYRASTRPGWMTGMAVSRALGADIHAVMEWFESGELTGYRLPGERGIMAFRKVTVYRWATRYQNWPHFHVEKMGDLHLRKLVELAQERWGDQWITTGEAKKIIGCIYTNSFNRRIRSGNMEGVRSMNWRVRLSEVNRLKEVFRNLGVKKTFVMTEGDRWILRARAMGWTKEEIGRSMKKKRKYVERRLELMRKEGISQ